MADAALKRAYDLFSIEYILNPRARDPNAPVDALTRQIQSLGLATVLPPSVSGGMMPLLTRKGFVDITAVEVLCDPSKHWGAFARMLALYDLPAMRAWGALPRSVLPEEADARMLKRVVQIQEFAKEQAERELKAVYVQKKLQAQGQAAALDLISDRRYYY